MRNLDSKDNGNLGAKRLPNNAFNDQFNDPKIQTEGNFGTQNPNPYGGFNDLANNPTVQNMAGNILKEQMAKQADHYKVFLSFDLIRPYFKVDNTYIFKKFKLIFLPFLQKGDWKTDGQEEFMRSNIELEDYKKEEKEIDLFGVDLYLPIMALITLTQIIGFYHGTLDSFDSEVLEYLIGKGMFIWFFEAVMIKLFLLCQGINNAPFMELV